MKTENREDFFDEVVDTFYEQIGAHFRNIFSRGQFFWTHVLYASENLQFWRPKNYDDTKTYAAEFIISSSTKDTFNRNTPLYTPPLKIDEEFPVVRAKRRPVILVAPSPTKAEEREIRQGGKVNLNLCIVAPLYSVADKDGFRKYNEDFVDRIRKLEFPHLLFIPENSDKQIRHSICRLDCLQACFANQLEAIDISLSEEVLTVVLGQVNFYSTGKYEGNYQIYRECLLNPTLC